MKELFKQHYQAIVNRGLINEHTSLFDFKCKIYEEYGELNDSLAQDHFTNSSVVLSNESIQESIDLVMTVFNMLQHNGVDIEKELIKNIETQEKRVTKFNSYE